MPGVDLRPYQREAVEAVEREWGLGRRRTLLVLPTGTGKTVVFNEIARREVERGGRALILAHRGELLEQAADKLMRATGLSCSVEKAGDTSVGTFERVTVGSVQTLMRERRLAALGRDRFSLIVVDEAHHAVSDSYRAVLDYFDAKVLGVTATADRGDRRDLGEVFDSLAYEYPLPKAIRDGYLVPIEAQTVPLEIDITGVSTRSGDYALEEVGTALDPYLPAIADEMEAAGLREGHRTVAFLPLVKTSQKFRALLERRGFRAAEVNGESADRAEVLAAFDRGEYDVLCNSMLLTEGWDCPAVDCVVVLRPTKVRSLYAQMVGRGTRLSPETGKERLLLLDFLWMTDKHELCRPAHLLAKSPEVANRMTEILEESPGPVDLEEAERAASEDVVAQREEALAAELAAQRKKRRKLVDPLQFEMSIGAEDLSGYVPSFAWEAAPASDKQVKALEGYGIYADEATCAGKASLLLDRLAKRREAGLSTPKQIRLLERYGFRQVGQWELDDASRLITRIAANGWRVPSAIRPAEYEPQPEKSFTFGS